MKPLIIGIDPGTTLGYAILDINGNLIKMGFSKQLNLSKLISRTINFGKPLIVGCDVAPAPRFVEKFSTKTGSKLIIPEQDLTQIEKNYFTQGIKTKNRHLRDALASALFAYKTMKPLLDKTDKLLEKQDKLEFSDQVKEVVIKKKISIKSALNIITQA